MDFLRWNLRLSIEKTSHSESKQCAILSHPVHGDVPVPRSAVCRSWKMTASSCISRRLLETGGCSLQQAAGWRNNAPRQQRNLRAAGVFSTGGFLKVLWGFLQGFLDTGVYAGDSYRLRSEFRTNFSLSDHLTHSLAVTKEISGSNKLSPNVNKLRVLIPL